MVDNLSAVGKTTIIFLGLLDFHTPCVMIGPDDPYRTLQKILCCSWVWRTMTKEVGGARIWSISHHAGFDESSCPGNNVTFCFYDL
jgi:hypothetical protein